MPTEAQVKMLSLIWDIKGDVTVESIKFLHPKSSQAIHVMLTNMANSGYISLVRRSTHPLTVLMQPLGKYWIDCWENQPK